MELHIHPEFQLNLNGTGSGFGGTCNATGRFLNDDGWSLDLEDNQNKYDFHFSSVCEKNHNATSIRLDISKNQLTTDKEFGFNDQLAKIVIYNANNTDSI